MNATMSPFEAPPARTLDITADTCPMTTVRTRLALDALPDGAVLAVRLRGDEPRRGVPSFCQALGHAVREADGAGADGGVTTLLIRKNGAVPA